ncbi:MAG TPA: response regulator transcription factor [Verrucomicrobiae bacterium]|nr:response regulator transcription factor [Verrucomicrobiae bacterium]
MKKIRVLLADDHTVVREALALLLKSQDDIDVVAEATNGREACQKAKALKPDVVVLDLSMPELSGLKAAEILRRDCPRVKVLALTMHEDESYLREMVRMKAAGYILKRAASEELLRAIREVASGGTHFDSTLVTTAFLDKLGEVAAPGNRPARRLTQREEAVLRLIAWGYTNREIAAKLSLSVKTIEAYKLRVGRKQGLHSRTEVVRYALQHGWLNAEKGQWSGEADL